MDDIASRLERLADAFEAHGRDVRSNLLPGASPAEIDAVEAELGVRLPQAYRELYSWSGGCLDHTAEPSLLFRDNAFLALADAVEVRRRITDAYGEPTAEQALDHYGVDLTATAPLAEFMGSTYAVVGGEHRLQPASANPVINVFQGIDVFFLSIESMIETCIEWVQQPDYEPYGSTPNELAIWLKHNPAVFP